MTLMSDNFKRGYLFDGELGHKTGANLEDLPCRLYPTDDSELVDQATLETYADAAVLDDNGDPVNRIRVKDGGIVEAKLGTGAVTAAKIGTGAITGGKMGVPEAFCVDKGGTNQSITGSYVALTWDTANPVHNLGTGTFPTSSTYKPGIAGLWSIRAHVTMLDMAPGARINLEVRKNVDTLMAQYAFPALGGSVNVERTLLVETDLYLALTDSVKITMTIEPAGTYTVYGPEYSCQFMGRFLGPTS